MRRIGTWLKWTAMTALMLLGALAGIGFVWERRAEQVDALRFPPPGQRVDVGGYRLHLLCLGTAAAQRPTIVLDTLSAGSSVYWAWIQPALAKQARVCAYDRAGFGWSDNSTHPPTLAAAVHDLESVLQRGRVAPPYVLVGHSKGGIIVRGFQHAHPEQVAGLVLLESSHPDQFARYPSLVAESDATLRWMRWVPLAARLGVMRLYIQPSVLGDGNTFDFGALPDRERATLAAFWSAPRHWQGTVLEMRALHPFFDHVDGLGNLGDLPLAVITAARNDTTGWQVLQNDLTQLSRHSRHLIVPYATHASLVFDPEEAALVSDAILQLWRDASAASPATSSAAATRSASAI